MKYILTFLFLCNILIINLQAQEERRCPHVHHTYDSAEHQQIYQEFLASKNQHSARTENEDFIIPIIVHVVHQGEEIGKGTNISFEQIQSQSDVLNEDFTRLNFDRENTLTEFHQVAGNMNIRFALAEFDPNGNLLEEAGVHRIYVHKHEWSMFSLMDSLMPSTRWDNSNYYNIWTVGNISGFLGFAQFPDSSGLAGLDVSYNQANTDGMVIDYDHFGSYEKFPAKQLAEAQPYHLGRTVTHEMGHALGLLHIWGDASNCRGNDFCEDTPQVSSSTSGCPLERMGCSTLAMVQNYMDYSYDGCMNLFTQNQVERMKIVLNRSPRRRELTQNAGNVLATERQTLKNDLQIYPNPAQNQIFIKSNFLKIRNIELKNLLGQTILSMPFLSEKINLPALPDGVYILKLQTGKEDIFKKILIQN